MATHAGPRDGALVGIYYSYRVQAVSMASDAATLFAFKNQAWRRIFWVSLPPGVLFVLGSIMVGESPRWLFRRGEKDKAYAALLRSRSAGQAAFELREMEETRSWPRRISPPRSAFARRFYSANSSYPFC